MSQNITSLFLLLWALPLSVLAKTNTETPYPFDKPAFIEQASQAGIEHRYEGPWEFFVGGGAAAFDCNQDRFADVFIAGGTNSAQLFINTSRPAGELRFEAKALNLPESLLKKVTGAYPININNDAHTDLIILRVGKNIILKGEGDCNFSQWNKGLAKHRAHRGEPVTTIPYYAPMKTAFMPSHLHSTPVIAVYLYCLPIGINRAKRRYASVTTGNIIARVKSNFGK